MLFSHVWHSEEPLASLHEEGFVDALGRRLFVRSWIPEHDTRAALVAVHGFHSHGSYYQQLASHLSVRGIAVHALDLRGHGKSAARRPDIRLFSQYHDDIDALMRFCRVRQPLSPLFLIGHGAGGVAASLYALTRQRDLAGLICESVALDLPASTTLFGCVRALALIAPTLPVQRKPARTVAALIRARNRLKSSLAQLCHCPSHPPWLRGHCDAAVRERTHA